MLIAPATKQLLVIYFIQNISVRSMGDAESGELGVATAQKPASAKRSRPTAPVVVPKTAYDVQRIKLERLMEHPERPVVIPEPAKPRQPHDAPEFVRNVMGSSAGAGSGEFHVYRHLRRKEYARQKYIDQSAVQDQLDVEFRERVERNRREAEERTAKKRAKRQRRKQKQKERKTTGKSGPEAARTEDESSSDEDDEQTTAADAAQEPANVEETTEISAADNGSGDAKETTPDGVESSENNAAPKKDESSDDAGDDESAPKGAVGEADDTTTTHE